RCLSDWSSDVCSSDLLGVERADCLLDEDASNPRSVALCHERIRLYSRDSEHLHNAGGNRTFLYGDRSRDSNKTQDQSLTDDLMRSEEHTSELQSLRHL